MVDTSDVHWGKNQCISYFRWPANRRPRGPILDESGTGSESGDDAATWGYYLSWKQAYYKSMLRLIGGHINGNGLQDECARYTSPAGRAGATRAYHVFWNSVLRGSDHQHQFRKIRRQHHLFSELQLYILSNEETNTRFFEDVKTALEEEYRAECQRYADDANTGSSHTFFGNAPISGERFFRQSSGGVISRQDYSYRNIIWNEDLDAPSVAIERVGA